MDETLTRLQAFTHSLEDFVALLRTCAAEQAAAEDRLEPLWDDTFAARFRAQYAELAGPVDRFTEREADHYIAFLAGKIAVLKGYLNA